MKYENVILHGHVLDVLKKIPDNHVQMVMTSPPYYLLRSYDNDFEIWDADENCNHEWKPLYVKVPNASGGSSGEGLFKRDKNTFVDYYKREVLSYTCTKCGAWKGCLGLEPTPQLYIKHLTDIFREVKRVLRDDGTIWLNIGDTYNTKSGSSFLGDRILKDRAIDNGLYIVNCLRETQNYPRKSLFLIPERLAIAFTDELRLHARNRIIWHKKNPTPSSAKDKFTPSYELVYFYSKKDKYKFNQQKEPIAQSTYKRVATGFNKEVYYDYQGVKYDGIMKFNKKILDGEVTERNMRDVWTITKTFKNKHIAAYPEELCVTPIKAGSDIGDIVLDPFCGSGTTCYVAKMLGRKYIGIDNSKTYVEMAKERLKQSSLLEL